jgi:hypothetical protein
MHDNTPLSPLKDARVRAVIERLVELFRLPLGGSPRDNPDVSLDPSGFIALQGTPPVPDP